MKGEDWPIVGYADRFSVAPGGTLNVMVSTDRESYTASVVRLGSQQMESVEMVGVGTYAGRQQATHAGSYIFVPHSHWFDHQPQLTVKAWIFPTFPAAGRLQGLVTKWSPASCGAWGLYLDEAGRLLFKLRGANGEQSEYTSQEPLRVRNWYHVTCSYDARVGRVRLTHQAGEPWPEAPNVIDAESSLRTDHIVTNDLPVLIGAGRWRSDPQPYADEIFDGKIENPSVFARFLDAQALDRLAAGEPPEAVAAQAVLASWDFSIGISSSAVTDSSPNRQNGTAINVPMRAATGHSWRAYEQSFADAPEQYAAIHFHSDDLSDAGWVRDFQLQIPPGVASDVYAVRLAAGSEADDIPFFVTADPSSAAPIAFLAPTFTYLAYGNKNARLAERSKGDAFCCLRPTSVQAGTAAAQRSNKVDPAGAFLAKHPELGISLYDYHADGSGSCYSSRLRPIVEMRPDYRQPSSDESRHVPRHFSADLLFLQWLGRKGFKYDVITDEELHADGQKVASRYRVLITGSHPEYYSAEMLDALSSFLDSGGKLLYLGGNGFYWVTSVDRDKPHIIEVRRGNAGTRPWSSEPGELYHSTTGELGGLWRHRGRSPNQISGVGFSAVGGVGASGYVRQPGSYDEQVAFIFRGLAADEVIGDFGSIDGGAAGDEVDRMDVDLGTPPSAILLASSAGLNQSYKIAIEDNNHTINDQDATKNPRVRADMVYHTRAHGGAVFAVGSINWFGSIGSNNDDNNVSRVTENVLRHFLVGHD